MDAFGNGNGNGNGNDGRDDDAALGKAREQFFSEGDVSTSRLVSMTAELRSLCTVDRKGNVQVLPGVQGAKQQLQVALAARAVAHRLNADIPEAASVGELAQATGLTKDVVSARCAELAKGRGERNVASPTRGMFRIPLDRVERVVQSLK